MNLKEIYSRDINQAEGFLKSKPVVSFEVYPPKDDESGEKLSKLINHLSILKAFNPAFISLTYGAGGTTQAGSISIIKEIQNKLSLNVMPHFTCVCSSKNRVEGYLEEINSLGINNILALRGDIPQDNQFCATEFSHANELVEFIKVKSNLSIGVAGYPEGHFESDDTKEDLKYLKQKVDAGAEAVFTQMFFDNEKYFQFVENARNIGIDIPIIPGILPILSYSQLDKMLSMARVTLPKLLMDKLDKFKDNPEDIKKLGIDFCSQQCQNLIDRQVSGIHFFTLNSSSSLVKVLNNLSL